MAPKITVIKEDLPETPSEALPATLSVQLESGGEAIFRIPTVRDLKAVERNEPGSALDKCRELGKVCLISWNGSETTPPDDEVDALDDQSVIKLMSEELIPDSDEPLFSITPDRTHVVNLSKGTIELRRLTRKDLRTVEGQSGVMADVLVAVSACKRWWRSDRPIMPADLEELPLREFRGVSKALESFLQRSSTPN